MRFYSKRHQKLGYFVGNGEASNYINFDQRTILNAIYTTFNFFL